MSSSSFNDAIDELFEIGFGVEGAVPDLELADVEPMPESDLTLEPAFFDRDWIRASRYT